MECDEDIVSSFGHSSHQQHVLCVKQLVKQFEARVIVAIRKMLREFLSSGALCVKRAFERGPLAHIGELQFATRCACCA